MDMLAKKLELPDWLLHINDLTILAAIDGLRREIAKTGTQNAQPEYGCLKGQIEIADDFDAPLSDFKEYMQ